MKDYNEFIIEYYQDISGTTIPFTEKLFIPKNTNGTIGKQISAITTAWGGASEGWMRYLWFNLDTNEIEYDPGAATRFGNGGWTTNNGVMIVNRIIGVKIK